MTVPAAVRELVERFDSHRDAEPYREVIHEDAIKIGGRTKAPDYCFRVGGGVRIFFVEAKKPSVGSLVRVATIRPGSDFTDTLTRPNLPWRSHNGSRTVGTRANPST